MLLDPRDGDVEDDLAAPKARSLLAIAGSLLAEISPLKLLGAVVTLAVLPNLVLGFAPLLATAWLSSVSAEARAATTLGSVLLLAGLAAAAVFGVRPLFRLVESNFWAVNALLVQPAYVLCREGFRQAAGVRAPDAAGAGRRAQSRVLDVAAGAALFLVGALVVWLAWPHTRWVGAPFDLARPARLVGPVLANALALTFGYAAFVALWWSVADARMDEPVDAEPDEEAPGERVWRVAHLSDVHVVGERYGFRIESGRGGPRGNERFLHALERLDALHAVDPLDLVLFSGDMTDAGRSVEWAEFLGALSRHPALRAISVVLPGNHDVNIIDRANPARLETPWTSARPLRRLRALSAMETLQGARARLTRRGQPAETLAEALRAVAGPLRAAANGGRARDRRAVDAAWRASFPQILLPAGPRGLGVLVLDSNADTHFSFTNALGLLSADQARAVEATLQAHPEGGFVVAMHHHLVEYPNRASALSIRIGTALINGSWIVRLLSRFGRRVVVMHGHRHVDWRGRCGAVRIVSGPSPVMGAADDAPTHFLVQRLQVADGALRLLRPERVDLRPPRPTPRS